MVHVRAKDLKTNIFIKPPKEADPNQLSQALKTVKYLMLTGAFLDTSEKKDKDTGQPLQGQFWYNLNPRWSSTFLIREGDNPGINQVLLVGEVTREAARDNCSWIMLKMDYRYFSPKEKKEIFSHRVARIACPLGTEKLNGRTVYIQGTLSTTHGSET